MLQPGIMKRVKKTFFRQISAFEDFFGLVEN